jgi:hypothetical protein
MRRHHYLQVSMIGAGDYYRYHTLNYLLVASPEESCAAGAGGDEGKDEFYRYPLSENETKTQFPLFRVYFRTCTSRTSTVQNIYSLFILNFHR